MLCPFERRFRAQAGGLAQVNAPKGTMIACATAPGTVAADGSGDNGLYTSKLVEAVKTPGMPIEEVFKKVRIEVSRETADAQTPWEASSPVGSYKPNAFGLYDMLGNVREWVEDCWNETYNGAPTNGSAWTSGDCSRRVRRGGDWGSPIDHVRAANRVRDRSDLNGDSFGFRVVRNPD